MDINDENVSMKTKQTSIRMPPWIHDKIEKIAKSKGLSIAEVVNQLLARELNLMGYTEADYVLGDLLPNVPEKREDVG